MYDFFKNISNKNTCQSTGVCAIHPSVEALYQILLDEIREISFYLVKLKEFGLINSNIMEFTINSLSIFMVNTNFNKTKYLNLIKKLNLEKKEIKNKYINHCKNNSFPCEMLNYDYELDENIELSQLIKKSQNLTSKKQINCDKTKQRLFELITLFAKLCSIGVVKIKKLLPDFKEFDYEIIRFFALTTGYAIRNEKIIRRIKEFSNISIKIQTKLIELYQEQFGKKEGANVNLSPIKGHSILVSGSDLDELKDLLETLKSFETNEEINVYTNGALFIAHFYPYFKNNKFLKGHFGSDNTEYDFSNFPGAILITQNFIQKIDSLYRGEIFSNKTISFEKVFDIENKNYIPLIEASLNSQGFLENKQEEKITIPYNIQKTFEKLENFNDDELIIVANSENEVDFEKYKKYENKTIINLVCPYEIDILYKIFEKIENKNIKIVLYFSECNLSSLFIALSLLNKNIELKMASCPYALINPHVIESLNNDFNVELI